jgi:hypothetical protein
MEDRPPAVPDPTFPPAPPSDSYGLPPTPPPPPPSPDVIPWERPGLDAFSAFGRTVAMLITSPRRAFESMPVTSAFGRPLAFGIIVGWIGVLAGTFWNLLLRPWVQSMLPWANNDRWTEWSATFRIAGAMAAPIYIPIALLIGTAFQHLFLFLVGGAKRGFMATFRVQCYAGATLMFAVVPVCGSLVGLVWSLVLAVIGLSAAHGISTGKAAAAVLLPLLLCCGCMALSIAIFGAAIFSAMGMHR